MLLKFFRDRLTQTYFLILKPLPLNTFFAKTNLTSVYDVLELPGDGLMDERTNRQRKYRGGTLPKNSRVLPTP